MTAAQSAAMQLRGIGLGEFTVKNVGPVGRPDKTGSNAAKHVSERVAEVVRPRVHYEF